MSRTAHVPQLTTMGHISDTRERKSNANHCSVLRFLSPLVMLVIHLAVFPFWVCLSCWSFISQHLHSGFACKFRFISFVFNGDPCERRRPRPRDSSTSRGLTTAPQSQEGQQLPLGTICHGDVPLWPFQRGRLECLCVGRLHVRTHVAPPCFRSGRWNARAKGKREQHHKHTARNTSRVLAKQCNAPPLYVASIPVWSEVENRQTLSEVSFLLPHEMLQHAVPEGAEHDWVAADASQVGFANRLRDWGAHLGVDTTEGHWACMSVWGDSAPFSAKASDSVFLLTWRLLTGCHRKRYWIFAVNKRRLCACGCFGRHTMDAAFQFLAWSFRALSSGRYPRHDHQGEPFAPSSWRGKVAGQSLRIRGACVAKTGDWAWLKQVVGLMGWNDGSRRSCCWLCNARFVAGSYDDASLAAEWRTSPVNMPAFWAELSTSGQFCSKVWSIPGLRIEWLRPDFMHMVDLGITQYLSGNICWFMFSALGGRRHGTPLASRAVCAHIMNMADMAAREGGLDRLHLNLTVRKFRAQNKPKLALKAADGRHFLPILLKVLQLFFPAGSPRERVMVGCVETLCDIYKELNTWDTTTSPPRVASLARRHVILLRELHDTSDDTDLWCIYPKHHMFVHLCESTQQTRVNPQLEWCYG